MKPAPITPERVLEELRTARYLTHLCISPSSERFKAFLGDRGFAEEARAILAEKIAKIEAGEMPFVKGAGSVKSAPQQMTLNNWRIVLHTVQRALARPSLKRV